MMNWFYYVPEERGWTYSLNDAELCLLRPAPWYLSGSERVTITNDRNEV